MTFDRTDEGGEELAANEMEGESETDTDLSLGDYISEDDIPDYKLRELSERAEKERGRSFLGQRILERISAPTTRTAGSAGEAGEDR